MREDLGTLPGRQGLPGRQVVDENLDALMDKLAADYAVS